MSKFILSILDFFQKMFKLYILYINSKTTISLTSAGVAQSVEQLICNQQVAGSSPISSSEKCENKSFSHFFIFTPAVKVTN